MNYASVEAGRVLTVASSVWLECITYSQLSQALHWHDVVQPNFSDATLFCIYEIPISSFAVSWTIWETGTWSCRSCSECKRLQLLKVFEWLSDLLQWIEVQLRSILLAASRQARSISSGSRLRRTSTVDGFILSLNNTFGSIRKVSCIRMFFYPNNGHNKQKGKR